jgi:hypothetical protein
MLISVSPRRPSPGLVEAKSLDCLFEKVIRGGQVVCRYPDHADYRLPTQICPSEVDDNRASIYQSSRRLGDGCPAPRV